MRPGLALDENPAILQATLTEEEAPTHETLQAFQTMSREELIEAQREARGLERWVIDERLREIAHNQQNDWGWEDFSWEEYTADLQRNPGQCRAVFVEEDGCKDGLVYSELHRPRLPVMARRYTLSMLPQAGLLKNLEPDKSLPNKEKLIWSKMTGGIIRNQVICEGDKPTLEELQAHCKEQGGGTWGTQPQETQDHILAALRQAIDSQPHNHAIMMKQWEFQGEPTWRSFTEIESKNEKELIETMLAQGALVADREIEIPEYDSVHNIEGGKCYRITRGEWQVDYVPHYSVGTQEVTHTKHQLAWTPSQEQIDTLKAKTDQHFADKMYDPESLIVRQRTYPDGSVASIRVNPLDHTPEEYRELVQEHAQSGVELEIDKDGKQWTEKIWFASEEELEQSGRYKKLESGKWMWDKKFEQYQSQTEAIEGMKKEWKWDWESTDAAYPPRYHAKPESETEKQEMAAFEKLETRVRQTGKSNKWPFGVVRLLTHDDGNLKSEVKHQHSSHTRREHIEHTAPMSERGVLTVTGLQPDRAMDKLSALGVSGGAQAKIPYKMIYRDGHRRGRVTPGLGQYADGGTAMKTPKGRMVLHGMTGVSNGQQALERFETLVQSGGLKSIAERRRAGVSARSLSPRGDIASGIDGGVPCTLSDKPSFGNFVVFGMKREVLARRDVWFSDQDFGGGHNRYDAYNTYADSIGQGKMHRPPDDHARQYHYDHGLYENENEVYFRHEIPWREVDCLFVNGSEDFLDPLKTKVKQWKKEGLLPESLKIIPSEASYNGEMTNPSEVIEKRALRQYSRCRFRAPKSTQEEGE